MERKKTKHLFFILIGLVLLLSGLFYVYMNSGVLPYAILPSRANVPTNGVYYTYYSNHKKKSKTRYHMGERDGVMVSYYKNGHKKESVFYKNGLKNGLSYYYTDSGALYKMALFARGVEEKSHIVNDSLYKHEVVIEAHGEVVFRKSCSACHHGLVTIPDSLSQVDDLTLNIVFNIDTVHYYLLDSVVYEQYLKRDSTVVLEKYDVKAIERFLEQEMIERKRIKVIRELRPNAKKI